ncbi:MAG: hypothetical protein AVDCRST_MAG48-2855, partial [uncultured Friedmanniella sp.]
MTSQSPEEIRAEIERTRANLSNDVDALAEEANPKNMARRQVDKVKDNVKDKGVGIKDRIMGTADDVRDSVSDTVHGVTGAVSDKVHGATDAAHGAGGSAAGSAQDAAASARGALSSAGDTVSDAPALARRKAQGNPLAAGLVAFGAGLLISSLIPASTKERELADTVKDKAQPLKTGITDAAKEVA